MPHGYPQAQFVETPPFVDAPTMETRDVILQAVRSAHVARREAQELPVRAQRAVGIAIEDSEKVAMNFL